MGRERFLRRAGALAIALCTLVLSAGAGAQPPAPGAETLPELGPAPSLAGLVGCFLFWALGVVKFPVAFSGFANDTAWFLFGALLIGAIATRSGVARRIAYWIMLRLGATYPRVLLGLIITGFVIWIPCIIISMIPVVNLPIKVRLGVLEAMRVPALCNQVSMWLVRGRPF